MAYLVDVLLRNLTDGVNEIMKNGFILNAIIDSSLELFDTKRGIDWS